MAITVDDQTLKGIVPFIQDALSPPPTPAPMPAAPAPPPPPTPAQAGFDAFASDPRNQQRAQHAITQPGQPIIPPAPPVPQPAFAPMQPQAPTGAPPDLTGVQPMGATPIPQLGTGPTPNVSSRPDTYKEWAAAHPESLARPTIGKGAGAWGNALQIATAGLAGAAGGLKGDPTAGLRYVEQLEGVNRSVPDVNQQRYRQAVVQPQLDRAALDVKNATAGKTIAQTEAMPGTLKQKQIAAAAKLGQKPVYDEQGNYLGNEADTESQVYKKQQSAISLADAQTLATKANEALRKAQKEYDEAKTKNIPEQMKLAQGRLAVSQTNAHTAQANLGIRAAEYNMHAFGTDASGKNELPGVLHDTEGRAIGSVQAANERPTATQRDAAGRADSMVDIGNRIRDGLKDPEIASFMGSIRGRVSQLQGDAGMLPEKVAKFRNDLVSYGAFQAGLHPVRGIGALNYFDHVMGGMAQDPEQLLGKLNSNDETAASVQSVGDVPTKGNLQKGKPHGAARSGGESKKNDPLGVR